MSHQPGHVDISKDDLKAFFMFLLPLAKAITKRTTNKIDDEIVCRAEIALADGVLIDKVCEALKIE